MQLTRTLAALGGAALLAGGLGTGLGALASAHARVVPGCHAADLAVSKARLDAGASQRFQNIRIRNTGDSTCRLTGFPTFTWRHDGDSIGFSSTPVTGQHPHTVLLPPG